MKTISLLFINSLFLKYVLTFFLLMVSTEMFSQDDTAKLVEVFERKSMLQPYFGTFKRTITFLSKEKNSEMYGLRFSPNYGPFAGISLQYKKLNIYFETSLPNSQLVETNDSDVRSVSLFLNKFNEKFGFTGFLNWNKGLLMYMPVPSMYGDRNDLRMITVGAHLYKIFNGTQFSYAAANSLTRLQKKSRGSLMLMITPTYKSLYSNHGIIPDSLRNFHLTGSSDPLRRLDFFSIQCRPGYIYNFVINNGKYFFSPALYAGAGTEFHTLITTDHLHHGYNLTSGYRIKVVTGVNGKRVYCSMELLLDSNTTYLYKTNITNTYREVTCNFGFRF